ncbi:MAG: hypothetical protein WBP12_02920 [Candidatus Saccharimonas sp.]
MVVVALVVWKQFPKATTFQECKDAGGAVMESYPEQCAIGGKTFVNEAQNIGDADAYVGLAETAALEKATKESKQARVVERDGESLPADMSFMPGRLNLYVKQGAVYKVRVEGQELQ